MKRLLLAAAVGLCACAGKPAYQDTTWGEAEKSVAKTRPLSPDSNASGSDRFRFEHAVIAGLKATVTYQFGENKGLQSVSVVFDPVSAGKDKYLDYYRQIKALLSEKYGPSEVDSLSMAAMETRYKVQQLPEYQQPCAWRTASTMITLLCGGACDGAAASSSITISYQPPRPRTEGL